MALPKDSRSRPSIDNSGWNQQNEDIDDSAEESTESSFRYTGKYGEGKKYIQKKSRFRFRAISDGEISDSEQENGNNKNINIKTEEDGDIEEGEGNGVVEDGADDAESEVARKS